MMKAVNERLFNDFVLNKHLNLLVEEWKKYVCKKSLVPHNFTKFSFDFSKITCIKKITSNTELTKIKKILGIQPQDQQMINYWIPSL